MNQNVLSPHGTSGHFTECPAIPARTGDRKASLARRRSVPIGRVLSESLKWVSNTHKKSCPVLPVRMRFHEINACENKVKNGVYLHR